MSADRFRVVRRSQLYSNGLPIAVQSLIYANLAMFTVMALWGVSSGMGLTPVFSPSTRLLVHAGGQFWPYVFQDGQWYRCITYAFSHGGLIHLAFNMMVLFQVGPMLERELGWRSFLFLYLFAALTATLTGLFWQPGTPVVGASGAIFGLVGFAVSFYHRIGDSLALARRNFFFQWAAIVLAIGIVGSMANMLNFDNAGHIGGLAGGAFLGWVVPTNTFTYRRFMPFFNVLGWSSLLIIVAAHLSLIAGWFL